MPLIEIRCPVGPRRLFTKLKIDGEKPKYVEGNLIEFSCPECRKDLNKDRDKNVKHVFHRYNFLGELIESEYE
jgi:transcription initiation factor IIE alpha subunit